MFTSADIYPLAQQMHALIPTRLQRWTGFPAAPSDRDHLADEFLMACDDAGPSGEVTGDAETSIQAVVISEALAGFLTQWGCRDGNLDDDVDRAQAGPPGARAGKFTVSAPFARCHRK